MNAAQSWGVILTAIIGVAAVTIISIHVLDWFIGRVVKSDAQKDVDRLFREARAREVMRQWTLDHDFVPRLSDPAVCQRCGYLRGHHEVAS